MKWPWRRKVQSVAEPAPVRVVVPELGPWLDVVEYATMNAAAIGDHSARRGNFVGYQWGPLVVGSQFVN